MPSILDLTTRDLGNAKEVDVPAGDGDPTAPTETIVLKNAAYDAIVKDGDLPLSELRTRIKQAELSPAARENLDANTPGLTDRDSGPTDFNDNARGRE